MEKISKTKETKKEAIFETSVKPGDYLSLAIREKTKKTVSICNLSILIPVGYPFVLSTNYLMMNSQINEKERNNLIKHGNTLDIPNACQGYDVVLESYDVVHENDTIKIYPKVAADATYNIKEIVSFL